MFSLECHCGNLKLVADEAPSSLTRCNCSICHRLGALWAYYDRDAVQLSHAADSESTYAWGERSFTYHRCSDCGCTTHYSAAEHDGSQLIAVNCRMAQPSDIDGVPIRDFDGLQSWKYLDEDGQS